MTAQFQMLSSAFYFVRHGVTDHNQARLIMGSLDIPLNDTGRRQARRAATLMAGRRLATIAASPLSRARETAEIIAGIIGAPVQVLDGLMERRWGVLEGRNLRERPLTGLLPDGAESLEDFTQRTLGALLSLQSPGPVLVVAHSGTCRVLRRHFAIDDGEGPVPNCVPLRFEPLAGGGWREFALRPSSRRRI